MANEEVLGPRKTMFVLVIVVGCFAVLWPRILSPLILGHTRDQLKPNQFDREAAMKQERPPMRAGPHPALRERGRAIPAGVPTPPTTRTVAMPPHVRVRSSPLAVYFELDIKPPPIPGMRPPLGSPGGPVPAPKSSMGFVMPIYTICIIVFFVYTLSKILFKRTGATTYESVTPDPQFRRRVFRDDSRTSPDKLGPKERDTIVTAISGLVAEVQQQMEASYAQNQQRQDQQDNHARPYTNGTVLHNTGPVHIVASEYREKSKEKTPEPKQFTEEAAPEPKDYSPEPEELVEEAETELTKEAASQPKEATPEPKEPISKLIETIHEAKEPTPEPLEFIPGPKEPSLEPMEPIPEPKEPTPEPLESILGPKKPSPEPIEPIPESKEPTPEPIKAVTEAKESTPELIEFVSKPKEPTTESQKTTPEPREPTPEPREPTPEPREPTPEPREPTPEPREPTPEPREPTPEPKEPTYEAKEQTPEPKEPIPEPIEKTNKTKSTLKELSPALAKELIEIAESNHEAAKEELIKLTENIESAKDDALVKSTEELEEFLNDARHVECDLEGSDLKQSTPELLEEALKEDSSEKESEHGEEEEKGTVKVIGMELTAHTTDGACPAPPPMPAPAPPRSHEAEMVKSIYLEGEIPQQSRVLVAEFEDRADRPAPTKHSPTVVSGKMTLSLIQDAPRETPERELESTVDDFTTASALTQPAAEKDEELSEEELEEEIEVEEIEVEEVSEEEVEEPIPSEKKAELANGEK